MLQLVNITKTHSGKSVLSNVCLEADQGEVLAILGPSGSGKSTLLKIVGGLESPTSGKVLYFGKPSIRKELSCVYLFQNALLFPHLNVRNNIAFGLKARGIKGAELDERINQVADLMQLTSYLNLNIHTLSGGEQQRVSFARALAIEPNLLLLDEPFSNLDFMARAQAQQVLKNALTKTNTLCLFVTHDVREALALGTRFGILTQGRLELFATAQALVIHPLSGAQEQINFWETLHS